MAVQAVVHITVVEYPILHMAVELQERLESQRGALEEDVKLEAIPEDGVHGQVIEELLELIGPLLGH